MTARMLPCAVLALGLMLTAACSEENTAPEQPPQETSQGVLVVNAFTQSVDVLVDGVLKASAVAPGVLDSVAEAAGVHSVTLRIAGTSSAVSVPLTVGTDELTAVAALRYGSALAASTLEDTNAIVPAGATKVRVLHLAPGAGEIQVFRTQPDWGTPIEWQFPFLYDSVVTDLLAHPFLQSTVGTWDVRAWRKPSEVGLGWDGTTARVTFALASGEKRTVLVLDRPGGGIRLSVIE